MGKKSENSPIKKLFIKFIHFITFINQPISKRFKLFFIGVLWWFIVMTFVSLSLINNNYKFSNFVKTNYLPIVNSSENVLKNLDQLILLTKSIEFNKEWTTQFELSNKLEFQNNLLANSLKKHKLNKQLSNKLFELCKIQKDKIYNLKKNLLDEKNNKIDLESKSILVNNILVNYISSKDLLKNTVLKNHTQFNDRIESLEKFSNILIFISIFIFLVALFLLLIFTMYIKKAISKPIISIINQVDKLVEGLADLNEKIDVNSVDEIGELSNKLNKLTEKIYEVSVFKKIIEEDNSLEDVFSRLYEIFTNMGLGNFIIYELDKENNRKIVFPNTTEDRHKDFKGVLPPDIIFCRALKANRIVSSVEFPKVCERVLCGEGEEHACIPLVLPNAPHMVVQFMISKHETDIKDKLKRAETFLHESRNVIETKRLMDKLRDSSIKDHLTGLHNRRFLNEILTSIIAGVKRRNENLCLVMGDIDDFKKINDNYGHDVGDKVLKMIADTFQKNLRESDLIIRYGGEEFFIILRDIEKNEAVKFTNKLRNDIFKKIIYTNNIEINCSISFGLCFYPEDSDQFQEAIKLADEALYRAKKEGKNKVVQFKK